MYKDFYGDFWQDNCWQQMEYFSDGEDAEKLETLLYRQHSNNIAILY